MTPYLEKKIEDSLVPQSGLGLGVVGFVCFDCRTLKLLG